MDKINELVEAIFEEANKDTVKMENITDKLTEPLEQADAYITVIVKDDDLGVSLNLKNEAYAYILIANLVKNIVNVTIRDANFTKVESETMIKEIVDNYEEILKEGKD